MRNQPSAIFVILLVLFSSCQRQVRTQFTILRSFQTGLDFQPLEKKSNPDDNQIKEFGNAVAVGDLNNDGRPDLVFTGVYGNPQLYINQGNLMFTNVTARAGIKKAIGYEVVGASIIDINNDGWNDIYFTVYDHDEDAPNVTGMHNLLYVSNKDGTYTERSAQYNLDIFAQYGMNSYFFDYDKDGDLDVLLLVWPKFTYNPFDLNYLAKVKRNPGQTHSILLENQNGKFTEVTAERGMETLPAVNNSVIIADVNQDGWQDVYVANDFIYPNKLYINHHGQFVNELEKYFSKTCMSTMGTDCEDINNDLYPDIAAADMLSPGHYRRKMNTLALTTGFFKELKQKSFPQYQRNFLHLNNQGNNFSDIGFISNAYATEWSWSPLLADYDNDGLKDAFFSAGSRKELTNLDHMSNYRDQLGTYDPLKQWVLDWRDMPSYQYHDFIFKNVNGLEFKDETEKWGLLNTTNCEGACYADLDGDGDLDIIVCNTNTQPFILRNNNNLIHPDRTYLRIALHAQNGINFPLGVKAYLFTGDTIQYQEAISNKGYLSISEPMLHFGTGNLPVADSLKIYWPSGKSQTIKGVSCNTVLQVYEKDAQPDSMPAYFRPVTHFLQPVAGAQAFVHKEDDFDDFKRDKIIPHGVSRSGPAIAVCDVDKDGLDDYYITGAKGQTGALNMQKADGSFSNVNEPFTAVENKDDETVAVFADVDGNGYADLLTGIGSNAENPADTFQHLNIWLNKGGNKFEDDAVALPVIKYPVGAIAAGDYDADGDQDIFVGCRMLPGVYGVAPMSCLLENQNGKFVDVSGRLLPQLQSLGMITAAAFSDIDGDNKPELIVTGEFLPITIFKYSNGKWSNVTDALGLKNTNGLWTCLKLVDVNGDGAVDILAGNWGDNSIWRASLKEPLSLWVNDFDGNGSIEPLLFHYLDGVNAPFVNRDLFCRQMPKFQNRFNNYESYAMCNAGNIFDKKVRASTKVLNVYTLHSSLFINDGKGNFTEKELPAYFQTAPVNAFITYDFNKDGHLDLMPLGNTNSNYYDQGDIDAMRGKIFIGDGYGNFKPKNGYEINRNYIVNSAKVVAANHGPDHLIVGVNNDTTLTYTILPVPR